MNAAQTLLKDSGIKSKIIKKYIPVINNLINSYLNIMGLNIYFELDENFNEKINARFKEGFSYQNFSQGEKQRINLAMLFTWRNIAKIKSSIDINLLIMDEIFDSSLDEDGIEACLKIINTAEIRDNSNVFIISHRNGLEDKFDKQLRVRKEKGFSKMEYV